MNLFAFQCFWTLAKAQQRQTREKVNSLDKAKKSLENLRARRLPSRRRVLRPVEGSHGIAQNLSLPSILFPTLPCWRSLFFSCTKISMFSTFFLPFRRNHGLLAAALSLSAELFRVVFFTWIFPRTLSFFCRPIRCRCFLHCSAQIERVHDIGREIVHIAPSGRRRRRRRMWAKSVRRKKPMNFECGMGKLCNEKKNTKIKHTTSEESSALRRARKRFYCGLTRAGEKLQYNHLDFVCF